MPTKDELRTSIKQFEPENQEAGNPRASHATLTRELAQAKRRRASREKANATRVTIVFRLEENDSITWKPLGPDGRYIGPIENGDELPMDGAILAGPDGESLVVTGQKEGLPIVAEDLPIREKFDPRRKYLTEQGSLIVYKRWHEKMDKPVVWSFKRNDEIVCRREAVLSRTLQTAKNTASEKRRPTQKLVAAWLISENPRIDKDELTEKLREAFPEHDIGPRHGPHYLSLSRTGRLPEPPDSDPREW